MNAKTGRHSKRKPIAVDMGSHPLGALSGLPISPKALAALSDLGMSEAQIARYLGVFGETARSVSEAREAEQL